MSSYLFPNILPAPHTEKAWFPSSYDMHNFSSVDALEQQEENYAKKLFHIAKTPAPDPIGSKLKTSSLSRTHHIIKTPRSEEEDEEGSGHDGNQSGDDQLLQIRRRRRQRVGATTPRQRVRRLPREEEDEDDDDDDDMGRQDDDSSTVVANREDMHLSTTQSSMEMEDMDASSFD